MTTECTERPISRPARLVDFYSFPSGTELNGEKVECIFFPRFNDREETFSLDVLAFTHTKEGDEKDDLNDDLDADDDAYRTLIALSRSFERVGSFRDRKSSCMTTGTRERRKR